MVFVSEWPKDLPVQVFPRRTCISTVTDLPKPRECVFEIEVKTRVVSVKQRLG